MASWYLLSSLGLYALAPGDGLWTLGSPLFASVQVQLPGGKMLNITAPNNGDGRTALSRVEFNGKAITGATLKHADLVQGGELRFVLA